MGVEGVETAEVAWAVRMSSMKACVWRLRERISGESESAHEPKRAPVIGTGEGEGSGETRVDAGVGWEATKKVCGVHRDCFGERGCVGASLEGEEAGSEEEAEEGARTEGKWSFKRSTAWVTRPLKMASRMSASAASAT